VDSAAGLCRGGFFLHLAEFLDAIWQVLFHMRSLQQHNDRQMKTKRQDVLCFPTPLVLGLMFWLSALFLANNAHAFLGDVVAEYGFPASSFAMSPTQPIMYATIPSQNSIAIINTNTLAASTVFVGSRPTNLALSPDGTKLYIANSATNFVVVFNTHTRSIVNSFQLSEHPHDVVLGTQNRLWVLGESYGHIFQIDATTGASTGPSISLFSGGVFIYSGSLEISPDRNTLYYGDYELSPSTMYKINVSGSTPVLVRQTLFGAGSNGVDLTLSHNGNFICYVTGSGQNLYDIAKFRTSDFASLGSFVTGPYPQALAFSPDDSVVYASVATASGIKVFNANTFLELGTISGPNEAIKLAVDSTGRYLFAGYTETFGDFRGTRVYDVSPLPQSQLGNISTRAFVQTGDNVMIGGFIVQGIQPKRVIIRAIGPELSRFGVPDVLVDPRLELYDGTGALIASNNNWATTIIGGIITSNQVRDIQASGHAPRDGRESAIIADLPVGNYTAIVRGVDDTTGVALAEVYDLNAEANSILGNISTRAFVQTDDKVMIGGFIVQGTQPKRVILRAIGPELSQFGVPDPLANPMLELHDSTGALIASNDNWTHTIIGGIITSDQVREIRSSGYAPRDGRESAIIATLPPGNYTAIVRGVNETTGVGLVEVYDLN
jgi:YVTN family beta-propeller protein